MQSFKFLRENELIPDYYGQPVDPSDYINEQQPMDYGCGSTATLAFPGNYPYEYKRNNRFILYFPDEFNLSPEIISAVTRPAVSLINGRAQWEDVTITITDPVGTSTSQRLMSSINTDMIYNTHEFVIEMLDPTGVVVERWRIEGILKSVDFGMLSYSGDAPVIITVVISVTDTHLDF